MIGWQLEEKMIQEETKNKVGKIPKLPSKKLEWFQKVRYNLDLNVYRKENISNLVIDLCTNY